MIALTPRLLVDAVGCTPERAERYAAHLDAACRHYEIDTAVRLAAFLAQVGHESGSFRYVEEIADGSVYEGRADLGNTQPGDGKRYKGRGLIQVTGRANHAEMTARLRLAGLACPDFEADPTALTQPVWAAWASAAFWDSRSLNAPADRGDFKYLTRRINGGYNHLAERQARWERAKRALADQAPSVSAAAAPSQENDMPLPLFALPAIASLAQHVPDLIRVFGKEGEKTEKNAKAAELVLTVAKDAIGAPNEQALVETLQADPIAVQQVREAVVEKWHAISVLAEVGGGVAAAAARDAAFAASGRKAFESPAFIISCLLLVFPLLLLVDVFYVHPTQYDGNLRTQIVTGVLLTISMVGAFWLGSSFGSHKKDDQRTGSTGA